MPLASELEATDRIHKLRKLYIVASRLALAIATPVAVVLGVSGGTILSLWVGPAYADQGALVAVLAAASLVNTSQWPAAEILQGITKHRIVAWTSIGAGVANVTLSILLLPVFGLMGVALGTLIPTVISSMFVVMPFANRTLNVSWSTALREIWLPGIAPAVPAALVLAGAERPGRDLKHHQDGGVDRHRRPGLRDRLSEHAANHSRTRARCRFDEQRIAIGPTRAARSVEGPVIPAGIEIPRQSGRRIGPSRARHSAHRAAAYRGRARTKPGAVLSHRCARERQLGRCSDDSSGSLCRADAGIENHR